MKKDRDVLEEQNQQSKLSILLETVRLGSISKAAERLSYTQSGLTYLLNTVESDLGLPLLKRSYSGVTFTKEGLELEPFIRALVEQEVTLRGEVDRLLGKSSEKICLGAVHSVANHWLPNLIAQFQKEYPNVHIELNVGGGADIPVWVKDGVIDFGIADKSHSGDFEWYPILEDQFYAAVPISWDLVPEADSIPIESLLARPMLFPSANSKNAGVMFLKDREIAQKILVSSADGTTLLSLVESGLGFTMLSKLYSRACPSGVRMLPTDPPIKRSLGILTPSYKHLRPLAKKFVSFLQDTNC